MKLRHLSLLIMIIGALLGGKTHATPLTPDEALGRVYADSPRPTKGHDRDKMKLMRTIHTAGDAPAEVYLFTSVNNGYLVVSADDSAPALLGYGDNAPASEADIPPAMQYWLEEYGRQIAAGRSAGKHTGTHQREAVTEDERRSLGPLLTTKWDQEAPYNGMCPEVEGMHCVSGCVATAMAQVMNYHQWPPKGSGSKTYTFTPYQTDVNDITLTCDFASVEFDWDNMLDTYNPPYSEAEGKAVAQLMYAAGVSVDMAYGPYVSGAMTQQAAEALVTYFDYDKGITVLYRDLYGIEEWGEVLYNQLDKYGPVVYAGANNNGGHAFVCDGYSTDGYFHFNWGWSGISDGYYLLTALAPPSQGVGGSSGSFNYIQRIIANVRPAESDSHYTLNLGIFDNFCILQKSAEAGSTLTVGSSVEEEYLMNLSPYTFTGICGVKITPCGDTGGEAVYTGSPLPSGLHFLETLSSYECTLPDNLEDGTYRLTPAARETDVEWHEIRTCSNLVKEITMTVTDGVCTFEPVDIPYITVKEISIDTDIYLDNMFRLSATLENPCDKEFQGTLCPALLDEEGEVVAIGNFCSVYLHSGESQNIDYTGSIENPYGSVTPGAYSLAIVDYNIHRLYSEAVPVTVLQAPESTVLSASEVEIPGQEADHVEAGTLQLSSEVKCEEGYYGGILRFYVYGPDTDEEGYPLIYDAPISNTLFLSSGESDTASATIRLRGAEEGAYYEVLLVDRDIMPLGDWKTFIVYSPSSGIGGTGTDSSEIEVTHDLVRITGDQKADIDVYSIDGVRALYSVATTEVSLASLPYGIYLVVITTPDGHRAVRKIIR